MTGEMIILGSKSGATGSYGVRTFVVRTGVGYGPSAHPALMPSAGLELGMGYFIVQAAGAPVAFARSKGN